MFECVAIFLLIIATVCAYARTTRLDFNPNPVSKMDDLLLLIPIPAFFMECIFTLVARLEKGAILPICISIFRVIQVLIQTPFIIDGRRRCTEDAALHKKKGRGLIIFLAIANMALWIYKTFSGKSSFTTDDRYGIGFFFLIFPFFGTFGLFS